MLNDWLRRDDFSLLRQKGVPVVLRALARMPLPSALKVAKAAAHVSEAPCHWWDIPAVRRRWQRLVTGNPERTFQEAFLAAHPAPPGGWTALSLGCGMGKKEREWAATGAFSRIDAWDVSKPRIAAARAASRRENLDAILEFKVADALRDPLPHSRYDLVLFEQSLHHFAPVRDVLRKVAEALRPGGLLFVNEFVGPSRFQWTDAQRRAVDQLLAELPLRYRRLWGSRGAKSRSLRPSKLLMVLNDPSEAADSASIMPAIRDGFEVLEERPYGGAVLQLLFEGIAHNFVEEDPETRRWLERCFAFEDALMNRGEIASDFVVVTGRKRA